MKILKFVNLIKIPLTVSVVITIAKDIEFTSNKKSFIAKVEWSYGKIWSLKPMLTS